MSEVKTVEAEPMPQIFALLPKVADEIGAVTKDKRNTQGSGFMYRGVDDVMNALHPIIAKYGITIVPEVLNYAREERTTKSGANLLYSILKMKYTFFAADGSNVMAVVLGEAMDSGDKASNKAMSIAFKYACFQVFCIPTEEMEDPDATTPEPSVPKTYNCVYCNNPFEPFVAKNGVTYTAAQAYHMSEKKYGRPLCKTCVQKLNAKPVEKKEG